MTRYVVCYNDFCDVCRSFCQQKTVQAVAVGVEQKHYCLKRLWMRNTTIMTNTYVYFNF